MPEIPNISYRLRVPKPKLLISPLHERSTVYREHSASESFSDELMRSFRLWACRCWIIIASLLSLLALWAQLLTGGNPELQTLLYRSGQILSPQLISNNLYYWPLTFMYYRVALSASQLLDLPQDITLKLGMLGFMCLVSLPSYVIIRKWFSVNSHRRAACSSIAFCWLFLPLINNVFATPWHFWLIGTTPLWLVLLNPFRVHAAAGVASSLLAALCMPVMPASAIFLFVAILYSLVFKHWIKLLICALPMFMALLAGFYVYSVYPGYNTNVHYQWQLGFLPLFPEPVLLLALPALASCLPLIYAGLYHKKETLFPFLLLGTALLANIVSPAQLMVQVLAVAALIFALSAFMEQGAAKASPGVFRQMAMLLGFLIAIEFMAQATLAVRHAHAGLTQALSHKEPDINDPHVKAELEISRLLAVKPRYAYLGTSQWAVQHMPEGTQRLHVGNFDRLWPLPAIQAAENKAAYEWFTSLITSNIQYEKPDTVIIDISPVQKGLPELFNILAYLERSPHFRDIWRVYGQESIFDYCTESVQSDCAYALYVRAF